MLKAALVWGVIAAAIMIAAIIVPFWFQDLEAMLADPEIMKAAMSRNERIGYLTMFVAMGLVAVALWRHRAAQDGCLSFLDGLKLGTLTSLVAALLFGLATVVLYLALGPEQSDAFMRVYMEHAAGSDPAAQAQALATYESQRGLWLNPWFQGFVMFATVLPIGVLVSLVAALVLRKN